MDFVKIGKIIPFPIEIKYKQTLITTAIRKEGSLNTRRFSIGFFEVSCSLENMKRKMTLDEMIANGMDARHLELG